MPSLINHLTQARSRAQSTQFLSLFPPFTVNSKSGDNQGVKFLRRFKQLLNPAQVFDLISSGPQLGLRLFRHFDPFRILICSGDGSVGWVLSEIDRLNMHVSKCVNRNVGRSSASRVY